MAQFLNVTGVRECADQRNHACQRKSAVRVLNYSQNLYNALSAMP